MRWEDAVAGEWIIMYGERFKIRAIGASFMLLLHPKSKTLPEYQATVSRQLFESSTEVSKEGS